MGQKRNSIVRYMYNNYNDYANSHCYVDAHVHTFSQVAIEKHETLFIDDPTKVPGLEKNEDWVKFGYGYYVGAPWTFGELKGES